MNFHPEDFAAVQEAVIHDGGRALPEECEGTMFTMRQPNDRGGMDITEFHTANCGYPARFEVAYDPSLHIRLTEDADGTEEPITICDVDGDVGIGAAVVCACDDAVGLWPRYANVCSTRSYQAGWELPRNFKE